MTNREQEPINNQEARVWELRDQIIGKLKDRGGDPTRRLQAMGQEMTRVANDEDRKGWSSLILHVNGMWSIKFGMNGYPIEENPTIDNLLLAYATVQDDDFKELQLRQLHESRQKPKSVGINDEELAKYYDRQDGKERRYIEENKPRLLQEFISSLETTLQDL